MSPIESLRRAKKNPNASKKLLADWKVDEQKFEKFFFDFLKISLRKLNDKELVSLWQQFHALAINRLTSSSIIDHFALGTDELVGQMLRNEVKNYYKSESDFTNIFSIATAPVHQSFINLAEIELLKIILGKSKETLSQYQKGD